jgi:mono/diheme cytochrome c family protein
MRVLIKVLLTLGVWSACSSVSAAELTLDLGQGPQHLSTAQLLAHPQAQRVEIVEDVSYHRAMTYTAVPVAVLLEGTPDDAALQVVALDGFAAELPAAPLLVDDEAKSRAWLAVEDPAQPWPALSDAKPGAGPFYLVWTRPQASGIVPEQWPYQIASIKWVAPAAERFPAMRPQAGLPDNDRVMRGFAVFRTNCMVCHTVNRQGDASMGPDLNVPHNPTEYLQPDFLRQYIRNPQSLRHWPQARMPAFSETILPAQDLEALIGYLTHMAGRKVQPATP